MSKSYYNERQISIFSDFFLKNFFKELEVSTNFRDYIGNANDWDLIVKDAFEGERGKNFIGTYKKVLEAQEFLG